MDIVQQFNQQHRPYSETRWLLAVSGGVDSVVLTDLCAGAGIPFEVMHMNFQLRETDSLHDEAFVIQLAKQYQVPVHVQRVDTHQEAEQRKTGIQETARELRYAWFETIRKQRQQATEQRCLIVTAHHADDSIETVCMNFFKGTGIRGLQGIPERNGAIYRPLLRFYKQQLVEYAQEKQLKYREDRTNLETDYTRNYFRNELLPRITAIYPKWQEQLFQNIERMQEAGNLYQQAVHANLANLIEHREAGVVEVPVLKLLKQYPLRTMVFELIRPYGFGSAQIDEVLKLTRAETGHYIKSSTHRILRNRKWLVIAPLPTQEIPMVQIEYVEKNIQYRNGVLDFQEFDANAVKIIDDSNTAFVDSKLVQFPLLLRRWKPGDYFYPLGGAGKKKINRFLIDRKLSQIEKESVWVLEMQSKIIWVIGQRIDHRFRVTPSTQKILQIRFKNADS